jgi:hypothetical protein
VPLGTDAILLTLGATGLASSDPELIRAAYLTMDLLASAALVPLALAALGTGILLGLGTRWGLARHWWVLAKLVLTIVGASAAVFLLSCQPPGSARPRVRVMLAPAVGVLLTAAVVLAVSKPWGTPGSAAAEPGSTPSSLSLPAWNGRLRSRIHVGYPH